MSIRRCCARGGAMRDGARRSGGCTGAICGARRATTARRRPGAGFLPAAAKSSIPLAPETGLFNNPSSVEFDPPPHQPSLKVRLPRQLLFHQSKLPLKGGVIFYNSSIGAALSRSRPCFVFDRL